MLLWFTSVLRTKYKPGFGSRELDVGRFRVGPFLPRIECLAQLGLHRFRVEVAGDAEDDVVGINVLLVPVQQVLAGDRGNRRVLGNAGVRIVLAVGDDAAFAMHDGIHVVVAARNFRVHLLLRQFQLVRPELGIVQQVEKHIEHGIEVALQAVERNRSRVRLVVGFDLGRARFQEVVHLIAGLGLGAAGAPDLAVEIGEPGLVRRFGDRAATDARGRIDQRQLVVLLEKDHHAVGQLNADRLLGREGRQRGRLNLVPGFDLGGREGGEQQNKSRKWPARNGTRREPQILRLRARPTRKSGGSERPRGRSAQDDK